MNRQVSFHAMAEQELNDAASYYNALRPGLGQAFLDEVERAMTQIVAYPEAAPLVNRIVRKKLVKCPACLQRLSRRSARFLPLPGLTQRTFCGRLGAVWCGPRLSLGVVRLTAIPRLEEHTLSPSPARTSSPGIAQ
jgi:hypothetical protein